jgi:membrane protein YdbS with pleckstrin-like domain
MAKELKNRRQGTKKEPLLPFAKMNYILFVLSLAVIAIGYVALGQKPYTSAVSLNVAPVLLVLGYVVLIPLSLLYKKREEEPAE